VTRPLLSATSTHARDERAERVTRDLGRPVPSPADPSDHSPLGGDHVALRQQERAKGSRCLTPLVDDDFSRDALSQHPLHRRGRVPGGDRDHGDVGFASERAAGLEETRKFAATRAAPRAPQMHQHEAPPQRAKRDLQPVRPRELHGGRLLRAVEPRDLEARAAGARSPRVPSIRDAQHGLHGGEQHRSEDPNASTRLVHDRTVTDRREAWLDPRSLLARRRALRNGRSSRLVGLAWWIVVLSALISACKRETSTPRAPAPAAVQDTAHTFHGGPAAHPGDWCGGHGVPESECTRCNPQLIPQFRARGDWCGEHAIPESQCTICHPELLGQGVAPTPAPAGPAQSPGENPGSDGGTAAAEPLPTVRLASPAIAAQVGIETVTATSRAMTEELVVPLRIAMDPARIARVSARADGLIRAVAVQLGARVRAGDRLVTLESATAAATRAEASAAQVRVANAARAHARALRALDEHVTSPAEVERAHNELAAARADLQSHRAASALVGQGGGALVHLLAPRDGIVIARNAAEGQHARGDEALLEIADLSSLWGILEVPDVEAPRLREGLPVTVEIDGRSATIAATLVWLSPTIDPRTRTVQARVTLPNGTHELRANAFGRARIAVTRSQAGVVVPVDALHAVRGREVVFVQRSTVLFEPHAVRVAARGAREVLLADAQLAGARVVTTGGFQLKTELLRDAIGAGCCDDEG
jgi:cobalt-zinc-cadmium efflux system membrane fusion protein